MLGELASLMSAESDHSKVHNVFLHSSPTGQQDLLPNPEVSCPLPGSGIIYSLACEFPNIRQNLAQAPVCILSCSLLPKLMTPQHLEFNPNTYQLYNMSDPLSYNNDYPGKIHQHNSGTTALGVTNHFLIEFRVHPADQNSDIVKTPWQVRL